MRILRVILMVAMAPPPRIWSCRERQVRGQRSRQRERTGPRRSCPREDPPTSNTGVMPSAYMASYQDADVVVQDPHQRLVDHGRVRLGTELVPELGLNHVKNRLHRVISGYGRMWPAEYVYLAAGAYRIQMQGNIRQMQIDNCSGGCTWYPSTTDPLTVYAPGASFGIYVAATGNWTIRFYRNCWCSYTAHHTIRRNLLRMLQPASIAPMRSCLNSDSSPLRHSPAGCYIVRIRRLRKGVPSFPRRFRSLLP